MELKDLQVGDRVKFSDKSDAFINHNFIAGTITNISGTMLVISDMVDARHRRDLTVGTFYTRADYIACVYSRDYRLITHSIWN